MPRIILALLLLLPFFSISQRDWSKLRKKSHETFAYRIPADSAEKYMKQDSIPVDIFLPQQPSFIFKTDSLDMEALPKGHFVLLKIVDTKIEAEIIGITDLVVYPLINEQLHILEIRNKQGEFIGSAKAWINGKPIKYDKDAMSYRIKQKKLPEQPLIKVYADGDTAFLSFAYNKPNASVLKQQWRFFKSKRLGRIITWLPNKISTFVKGRHPYKSKSIGANGYMVFNQPKYKLTDTVKLKAYIVNRKWKQYNEKANIYLTYYANGQQQEQLLTTLKPDHPGSFVYDFPLSDTLTNDLGYTIEFRTTHSKKRILASNFRVEDYVLDEVAKYSFRSSKEDYYKGDSMVFYANAKDANDLPLLDAKAKLLLISRSVSNYDADSIYVADTMFVEEKTLLGEGDTKFTVTTGILPMTNQQVLALLQFRNSNNEIHQKEIELTYELSSHQIRINIVADTVYADYYKNNLAVEANGELAVDGDNNVAQKMKVHYPFKIKLDALAKGYDFYVKEKDSTIASGTADIPRFNELGFSRISTGDTVGFLLSNPYKVPVAYWVLDGKKIITEGRSSGRLIQWKHRMQNKRKSYTLKYDYVWKGEQRERSQNIALLYKILNIAISGKNQVFPGQKDSVMVEVKDYKGNPVGNVNMVAASYNSQFKKDIRTPEPPYLARYKQRPTWRRGFYKMEEEDIYFKGKYLLGRHQQWRQKFGVDSLLYYQMLFPKKTLMDVATYNTEFMPQMGLHVVQQGQPLPIYLLYLNRQLVYYEGVTSKMADSYQTNNYYTQIGVRLLDRYIEMDSVYVQPNYKHDFVIDLDKLPANTKVFNKPNYYDANEKALLERNIWQVNKPYESGGTYFGGGYVWQNWKVAEISNNNYRYAPQLIGPFSSYDSLHFFAPSKFDIHFKFEPYYIYDLSSKILRLEKNFIFKPLAKNAEYNLPVKPNYRWSTLGDTLVAPPMIEYPKPMAVPSIQLTPYNEYNEYMPTKAGNGKLTFTIIKDTSLRYVILQPKDRNNKLLVLNGNTRNINNIVPGTYQLILVSNKWRMAMGSLLIKGDTTVYVKTKSWSYQLDSALMDSLTQPTEDTVPAKTVQQTLVIEEKPLRKLEKGKGIVQGTILDASGDNPIPNASVQIKGTSTATASNTKGEYILANIKSGTYTLIFYAVGYSSKELKVEVVEGDNWSKHMVSLIPSQQRLDDVVVIGYSTVRRKDITGSVSVVRGEELFMRAYKLDTTRIGYMLQGRVPGLNITSEFGAEERILIRGAGSFNSGSSPIYVIDGIVYDEMPKNISPDLIDNMEVLKDAAATAIYGSRGANGVVIVSTKTKTLRTQFRDYAFWKPEFFTDKNGKASFAVTYPDNITGWETYVLGMDKKRRVGKAFTFVKSFKPLMAQLSTPQFLIEGDHAQLIGKAVNYTADTYTATTSFNLQDKLANENNITIASAASIITPLLVTAGTDTLKARFQLQTSTNFKDGEERKIPVFKRGTEETIGQFWILKQDTAIHFKAETNASSIEITALNNTLDILLDEIEHLKKYPYYCMEQTASKLRGLTMEKNIRETLKQPFKNEKELNQLLSKLQKAQHFDGSWSWWETGTPNIDISNYIINALLPLRENGLVETNVRNGLLYLQHALPYLKKNELLAALTTMAAANHAMDYQPYLDKINFDSLGIHQQWQYVSIKQQQKMNYANELDSLLKRSIPGILGSIHWGEENYRWYSNANATTVAAYNVLRKDEKHSPLNNHIVQYFLEQRKEGYWCNTVESANILSSILPDVLEVNKNFNQPATLQVSGDTSFVIGSFPFKKTIGRNNQSLQVSKTGGGFTYFSMYQKIWNNAPATVSDNFEVSTYFEKNGQQLPYIKSGERMKMVVKVDVKKEAEYVMLEVPIPAGCKYATKKQDNWNMHKEFMKNKMLLFAEQLSKGVHLFEIELEPRYNGTYTVNPAKATLMYFPIFYGRNEMKQVEIKEQ